MDSYRFPVPCNYLLFANFNYNHTVTEITKLHASKIKEVHLIHMYKYFDWEKQRRDIIYSIVSH